MKKPLSLDLFCGIGGLTLGLENAGFESIGGIDVWKDAANTFDYNFAPKKCFNADITQIGVEEIENFFGGDLRDISLLSGGPPCQGFSTIGKRDPKDPRNKLWQHFLGLVNQIRPPYVLIENVEGLVVMEKNQVCQKIVSELNRIGYEAKWKIIRAADYGVPQLRKRVFFFAWLKDLHEPFFPEPQVEKHITVAQAIFDLPPLKSGEMKEKYLCTPQNSYQKELRGRSKKVTNHEAANHPDDLIKVLSFIPDGGNRKSIPDKFQPKSGFHNSYARLDSKKPAIAVTSNMRKPSSARATHPIQNRGLTVREGLRLQSFHDDFFITGTRTSQYLQVGNAVPPLLAQAVGNAILAALKMNSESEIERAKKKSIKLSPLPKRNVLQQLSLV